MLDGGSHYFVFGGKAEGERSVFNITAKFPLATLC